MAALWLVAGLITALVMGRLGHDPKLWLALGVIAGPASVALVARALQEHDLARPARLERGGRGRGPVDVLVGVDGSPESTAALEAAVDLFGDRLGRLALATVADFDAGYPESAEEVKEQAEEHLAEAREIAAARGVSPEVTILFGPPATTLEAHARDNGFELVAVGTRGRGLAVTAFGSVATHMARAGTVPVLISSA